MKFRFLLLPATLAATLNAIATELHDTAIPEWKEGELLWNTGQRAQKKYRALQEILAKGTVEDVNAQDAEGRTPLVAALKAYAELPENVRPHVDFLPTLLALLKAGAEVSIPDHEGKDARYYMAQTHAPQEMSRLLLPAESTPLRRLVMQKEPLPPMALVRYGGILHHRGSSIVFGKVVASTMEGLPVGARFQHAFPEKQHDHLPNDPAQLKLAMYSPVSQWEIVLEAEPVPGQENSFAHHGPHFMPAEQLLPIKGSLPEPLANFRAIVAEKELPANEAEETLAIFHNGNEFMLRRFLATVDVNAPWERADTPLLCDIIGLVSLPKRPEILRALLDANARLDKPNAPEGGGITPLHITMGRHPENTALLLAVGAPADARDAIGRTPLMHAVMNMGANEARVEAVRQLIQAGADVNAVDDAGLCVLDYAVTPEPVTSWPHEGSAEEIANIERLMAENICRIVNELLKAGAKVNGPESNHHNTPLNTLLVGRNMGHYVNKPPQSITEKVAKLLLQAGGITTKMNKPRGAVKE